MRPHWIVRVMQALNYPPDAIDGLLLGLAVAGAVGIAVWLYATGG